MDGEAEGDAGVGVAVDEVGSAVNGVDDEGRAVGDLGLAGYVRLLADKKVGGVEGLEAGGDMLLDGLVCLGHNVDGWNDSVVVSVGKQRGCEGAKTDSSAWCRS